MTILLHLFTYVAVVIAAVAVVVKAYKYATMPIHLRWELYPVPKEGEKARHGGSFYEDGDWWTKKRHASLISEIMAMVQEMIFIKVLYENNRKLWYRSFPFHFGLYMLLGAVGLAILTALADIAGLSVTASPVIALLTGTITIVGGIGLTLATLGALALLHRRLTDPDLEGYTAGRDIFNLVIFIVAFICAWVAFVFQSAGGAALLAGNIRNLLTFNMAGEVGGTWAGLTWALFSFLLLYVPLSHMSHFITKYFLWHKVRWDDSPNLRGNNIEKQILINVAYPVSWSAPHLHADGKKNWVDIATEELPQK